MSESSSTSKKRRRKIYTIDGITVIKSVSASGSRHKSSKRRKSSIYGPQPAAVNADVQTDRCELRDQTSECDLQLPMDKNDPLAGFDFSQNGDGNNNTFAQEPSQQLQGNFSPQTAAVNSKVDVQNISAGATVNAQENPLMTSITDQFPHQQKTLLQNYHNSSNQYTQRQMMATPAQVTQNFQDQNYHQASNQNYDGQSQMFHFQGKNMHHQAPNYPKNQENAQQPQNYQGNPQQHAQNQQNNTQNQNYPQHYQQYYTQQQQAPQNYQQYGSNFVQNQQHPRTTPAEPKKPVTTYQYMEPMTSFRNRNLPQNANNAPVQQQQDFQAQSNYSQQNYQHQQQQPSLDQFDCQNQSQVGSNQSQHSAAGNLSQSQIVDLLNNPMMQQVIKYVSSMQQQQNNNVSLPVVQQQNSPPTVTQKPTRVKSEGNFDFESPAHNLSSSTSKSSSTTTDKKLNELKQQQNSRKPTDRDSKGTKKHATQKPNKENQHTAKFDDRAAASVNTGDFSAAHQSHSYRPENHHKVLKSCSNEDFSVDSSKRLNRSFNNNVANLTAARQKHTTKRTTQQQHHSSSQLSTTEIERSLKNIYQLHNPVTASSRYHTFNEINQIHSCVWLMNKTVRNFSQFGPEGTQDLVNTNGKSLTRRKIELDYKEEDLEIREKLSRLTGPHYLNSRENIDDACQFCEHQIANYESEFGNLTLDQQSLGLFWKFMDVHLATDDQVRPQSLAKIFVDYFNRFHNEENARKALMEIVPDGTHSEMLKMLIEGQPKKALSGCLESGDYHNSFILSSSLDVRDWSRLDKNFSTARSHSIGALKKLFGSYSAQGKILLPIVCSLMCGTVLSSLELNQPQVVLQYWPMIVALILTYKERHCELVAINSLKQMISTLNECSMPISAQVCKLVLTTSFFIEYKHNFEGLISDFIKFMYEPAKRCAPANRIIGQQYSEMLMHVMEKQWKKEISASGYVKLQRLELNRMQMALKLQQQGFTTKSFAFVKSILEDESHPRNSFNHDAFYHKYFLRIVELGQILYRSAVYRSEISKEQCAQFMEKTKHYYQSRQLHQKYAVRNKTNVVNQTPKQSTTTSQFTDTQKQSLVINASETSNVSFSPRNSLQETPAKSPDQKMPQSPVQYSLMAPIAEEISGEQTKQSKNTTAESPKSPSMPSINNEGLEPKPAQEILPNDNEENSQQNPVQDVPPNNNDLSPPPPPDFNFDIWDPKEQDEQVAKFYQEQKPTYLNKSAEPEKSQKGIFSKFMNTIKGSGNEKEDVTPSVPEKPPVDLDLPPPAANLVDVNNFRAGQPPGKSQDDFAGNYVAYFNI